MEKKFVAVTIIAIAALIVAIASLAFAFSVISIYQPGSSSSTPTPPPTTNPTIPDSTFTPTPTPINQPSTTPPGTEYFNLNYTIGSWNADNSPSVNGAVPSTILSSGTYKFNIRINNPEPNPASPQPCYIRLTITELNKNSASPSDATLGINTQGRDLYNAPAVMYSRYTQINATANANTLTYLFAPAGGYWRPYIEYLSSTGFNISSGFDRDYSMKLDLSGSGQYRITVDVIPAV